LAGDWNRKPFGQLHYSIQSGKTTFENVYGMGLFDWLAKHPVDASMFSETMVGLHGAEPEAARQGL
jgi:hypothetical protein